jgi:hypothetical protein
MDITDFQEWGWHRQQWWVVTLLDSSRRHQQSLFKPTAIWMNEIVYQNLQMQQGLCEVHGSL